MSILGRAFLYVTRKQGKTVLLFAILLIMGTSVLTGLSIRKASEAAQLDLRQSLGGQFNICVDWENSPYIVIETVKDNEFDEKTGKISSSFIMYSTVQLTPGDVAAIKSLPGVKYCSARQDHLVPFDNLYLFPGTVPVDEKLRHNTKVFGVCGTEDDELFTTGTLTLAGGRHIVPNDQYVAIISQDLAKENELNIGDYITTHVYNMDEEDFTGKEIQVQIIGLFASNAIEQPGETVTTYDIIRNRIFVDLQTTKELGGDERNYGFDMVNVTIDDPQNMERIVADVNALPEIDRTAFIVDVDNETYENAAAPLAALNDLVVTLLVMIIVVSAIMLTLILTFWTKTRIREIGVFLSMGFQKSVITRQYLMEALLIAVPAFGISYFISNAIAGRIGNYLLEQSIQAENGIQVSVGVDNLILLYMIGFAIIALAVSVSSITVMRLKPQEILSKMS